MKTFLLLLRALRSPFGSQLLLAQLSLKPRCSSRQRRPTSTAPLGNKRILTVFHAQTSMTHNPACTVVGSDGKKACIVKDFCKLDFFQSSKKQTTDPPFGFFNGAADFLLRFIAPDFLRKIIIIHTMTPFLRRRLRI